MEVIECTRSESISIVREQLNLTQTELAKKTGLTQSNVSVYESGKFRIRFDTLFLLFKKLGIRIEVRVQIKDRILVIYPGKEGRSARQQQ